MDFITCVGFLTSLTPLFNITCEPSFLSHPLQLRWGERSLTRPQPHGFAGESWVGAPPFFPPESAQGVLPVPLRLGLWHVPQNHVAQLLHQQWGVSMKPSPWTRHGTDRREACFLKSGVSTHTHTPQLLRIYYSHQHSHGCDCNYAIIMLMKSWWILLAVTVALCFLAFLSESFSQRKPSISRL